MGRRRGQPFAGALAVERGVDEPHRKFTDGSLPVAPEARVMAAAGHGLDRIEALSGRSGALLQLGLGLLGTAALWALRLGAPTGFYAVRDALGGGVTGALAMIPVAVAVYGAQGLLVPSAPPGMPEGQFGNFLEAQRAETAWRRRLVASALGFLHSMFLLF